ncbi:MAG: type II toxin-antitoxin system Phd/YefM family antitoxin [Acidobacteria bacterium]|nr:type II toxin-antitoxin system Phd/YefM family antitoxin [Acidobacteriota bacterium]
MIKIDRDIRSLSDFKRKTPEFLAELERTHRPVVLTVNGRAKVVVQDAESYQEMADALEFADTVRAIHEGLKDVESGDTMSLEEFDSAFRKKIARSK